MGGEGVERIESFSVFMEKLDKRIKRFKREKDLSEAQMKLFVFLLQFNESFIIYITVQHDRYFFFYFETLYNHKIVRLSVRRVIK